MQVHEADESEPAPQSRGAGDHKRPKPTWASGHHRWRPRAPRPAAWTAPPSPRGPTSPPGARTAPRSSRCPPRRLQPRPRPLRPRRRRFLASRPCQRRPQPPERGGPLRLGRQRRPAAARGGTRAAARRARGWRQGLPASPAPRRPRTGRWRGRSRSAHAAARPSWPRRGRHRTRPPSPASPPGARCRLR